MMSDSGRFTSIPEFRNLSEREAKARQSKDRSGERGYTFLEVDYSKLEPVVPGVNDWWKKYGK